MSYWTGRGVRHLTGMCEVILTPHGRETTTVQGGNVRRVNNLTPIVVYFVESSKSLFFFIYLTDS